MISTLNNNIANLAHSGRGLLDSSVKTSDLCKLFEQHGIPCNSASRRVYRTILIESPGIEDYISGVILDPESIKLEISDFIPIVDYLNEKGVLAGVRIDTGRQPFIGRHSEWLTEGTDGLWPRLAGFRERGIQFAGWRTLFRIEGRSPTRECIAANADRAALCAAMALEQEMVPLLSIDIQRTNTDELNNGETIVSSILREFTNRLKFYHIDPRNTILETTMVPARHTEEAPRSADGVRLITTHLTEQSADSTFQCLSMGISPRTSGVFLSPGIQTPSLALEELSWTASKASDSPWPVSFSFGPELENQTLDLWRGNERRRSKAQRAFIERAEMCYHACNSKDHEQAAIQN